MINARPSHDAGVGFFYARGVFGYSQWRIVMDREVFGEVYKEVRLVVYKIARKHVERRGLSFLHPTEEVASEVWLRMWRSTASRKKVVTGRNPCGVAVRLADMIAGSVVLELVGYRKKRYRLVGGELCRRDYRVRGITEKCGKSFSFVGVDLSRVDAGECLSTVG